jgi:hypothetical protein
MHHERYYRVATRWEASRSDTPWLRVRYLCDWPYLPSGTPTINTGSESWVALVFD